MKPMFGGISRGRGEASSPEVPFRVPSEYHEPEEYHATIRAQHTAPDHSTMRYTAARATRALRVPLTCIGRSRRLGASVPWGAPSAGASSARCARLRPASWPPPPEGSKGGRRVRRRRACARAKHRSRRSLWAPSGDRSHMRPPVGAGRPGAARCAELPGAPSLRRCGGRARARPRVLPGMCTLTMRRCRPQHLDGEADRGRGRASRIPGARALDPPGYRVRVGGRLRYAVAVAGRGWILHLAYVSRNWPVRRFAARSQSASKLSSPSARKRRVRVRARAWVRIR